MTLLEKIREDSLQARKNKDGIKASLLTTLYSEAAMVGKNKRNGLSTDEEVMSTIQKFAKNANEVKTILERNPDDPVSVIGLEGTNKEIEILNSYLPKGLSENELTEVIKNIIASNPSYKMGDIMKELKTKHNGSYDGKKASEIIKSLI